jgi:hypothetical protein
VLFVSRFHKIFKDPSVLHLGQNCTAKRARRLRKEKGRREKEKRKKKEARRGKRVSVKTKLRRIGQGRGTE